ncbi:MAG: hypothetical protein PVH90_07445 [Gammaproteobacteria bacterium]|jgi:hypothetical protein
MKQRPEAYHFMLDPLHDDARWQRLLERAGVSNEQLGAIRFEIDLPD